MQASEFEKKVQLELEQLKLRPSDEVWANVEKELRKKKKRRVLIVIFFLAGLALLGYPAYQLLKRTDTSYTHDLSVNTSGDSDKAENLSAEQQPLPKANTPGNTPVSNEKNNNNTAEQKSSLQPAGETNQPTDITAIKPVLTPSQPANETGIKEKHNSVSVTRKITSSITPEKRKNNSGRSSNDGQNQRTQPEILPTTEVASINKNELTNKQVQKNNAPAAEPVLATKGGDLPVAVVAPHLPIGVREDSLLQNNPVMDSAIAATVDTAAKQTQTAKKTGAPKIKWMLDLSAGLSSSRENAFISADKAMADQLYFSSPTIANGALGQPVAPPSAIKPDFGFRVGLLGELVLSKRSSLVSGIQYAFKSNRIKVGRYVDTSITFSNYASQSVRVGSLYQGVQTRSFTNHYHFIQVPLMYQLQLNQGKKLPILWNIGGDMSYLVATNGLLYSNARGGFYYKDMKAYNRFQFNLNTAFYLKFGTRRGLPWMIGPELSLDMTKLAKEAYGNKQYLLYSGITGRMYLPKKKK